MTLTQSITENKIIVVIRGVESEKLIPLCSALYNGGVRIVEIAFSQIEEDLNTYRDIKMLAETFRGKLHVGAGTVLNEKQVKLTHKAGGEFVVSPDSCSKVIKATKKLKMLSISGAYTPTEVIFASRLGADFVKLFPVSTLGTKYLKALKTTVPNIKLLAFGGIAEDNLKEYMSVGISGIGVSSGIVDKKAIEENDFIKIEEIAKRYVKLIKQNS